MTAREWLGEDWEDYCLLLFRRFYGADQVQEVPARHGGDLGIEAFTFSGRAFQCYAAQEPLSTAERYEKQRDKLTTDLTKLETRQVELVKLLGQVKIKTYIFMVPLHDSYKIVQHATAKSIEFRQKNLAHLDTEFEIVVLTDDAYATQRSEIQESPVTLVDIEDSMPEEVNSWTQGNQQLVTNMRSKLAKLPFPQASFQENYLDQLVTQFLDGSNALAKLRDKYPDQWQFTERCMRRKEQRLLLDYPPTTATQIGVVKQIADDLICALENAAPALDRELAETISWSSIADWLMRCPLDFPAVDGGADV